MDLTTALWHLEHAQLEDSLDEKNAEATEAALAYVEESLRSGTSEERLDIALHLLEIVGNLAEAA